MQQQLLELAVPPFPWLSFAKLHSTTDELCLQPLGTVVRRGEDRLKRITWVNIYLYWLSVRILGDARVMCDACQRPDYKSVQLSLWRCSSIPAETWSNEYTLRRLPSLKRQRDINKNFLRLSMTKSGRTDASENLAVSDGSLTEFYLSLVNKVLDRPDS